MSTNGRRKTSQVRFALNESEESSQPAIATATTRGAPNHHAVRRHKRPRLEQNEDEMDDIDDWQPDDDDEDDAPYSQRQLLQAKQKRRQHDNDTETATPIDASTSLASEGISIEPFNMEQEQSDGTGYFDGDTYVFRKRDNSEEPDAWLESLGGNDKQPYSKQQDTGSSNSGSEAEVGSDIDDWTEQELYAKILPLVSDTETVTQAIIRYGNLLKRRQKPQQQDSSMKLAQTALNELTEAANALLLKGQVDIYQTTRNEIVKLLPHKDTTSTTGTNGNTPHKVKWEYQGMQDGQIHGPYATDEMLGWIQAGYFVGPSVVKVRTAKEESYKPSANLKDELLSDLLDDVENDNEKPSAKHMVYGEWQMSDHVDFRAYL